MKQDYETNKRKRSPSPASSSDSKSSLEIYYKALSTYPPEMGESNAESAERTRLVETRIQQLKKERDKRKDENKKDDQAHKGKVNKPNKDTKKYLREKCLQCRMPIAIPNPTGIPPI